MRFGLLIVLLLLAACSSRPGPDVLNATATPVPPGARVVTEGVVKIDDGVKVKLASDGDEPDRLSATRPSRDHFRG